MGTYPTLFSPLEIGGVALRNRLAHAAVVTRFVQDGRPTSLLLNYLGNRARGGAGLIVTEPIAMASINRLPDRLRAYDDAALDGLKQVAETVEQFDTRLIAQLQDPGRGRHEAGRNDHAVGASALPDDLSWTVPHVLSVADIRRLIDEWSAGALRLKNAGFSGVEISAGHGHLFHQFLSPRANRRDDDYGGDLAGRTHLLRELMHGIRAACGRPFIIGLKLPGDDGIDGSLDVSKSTRIAEVLAATGEVDYWTFVWGAHANSLYLHLPNARGAPAPYLESIRELRSADRSIVTGAIGYITEPNEAERALNDGTADLVFLGRPLITDAAWGIKAQQGREAEIRGCVTCNTCWRSVVEARRLECDNNPRVGADDEADWHPARTATRRRLVVVGAGIAGLEAAWVAAARGHDVTVIGASDEAGGKTRLHALLPGGERLCNIYDYQVLACRRHEVQFEFGAPASVDTISALEPDAVLLATGAHLSKPAFLPDEYVQPNLVPDLRTLVAQLANQHGETQGRLVLIDCDHTEMTYAAAEYFAGLFEFVTIVTPRERIASDCALVTRQEIYQRLYERGVEILTNHEPLTAGGLKAGELAAINVYNGEPLLIKDIAALTYATARVPNDELLAPLEEAGLNITAIGDCYAPRSVLAATRDGHRAGLEL